MIILVWSAYSASYVKIDKNASCKEVESEGAAWRFICKVWDVFEHAVSLKLRNQLQPGALLQTFSIWIIEWAPF